MSPRRPVGIAVAVAVAGSSALRGERADREDRSSSLASPTEVERVAAVETAAASTTHTYRVGRSCQELVSLGKQRCGRSGRGARGGEGGGGGARGGGREGGGGREEAAERPGSHRRYKARLSSPEIDEGTWGVGRVSWSLY